MNGWGGALVDTSVDLGARLDLGPVPVHPPYPVPYLRPSPPPPFPHPYGGVRPLPVHPGRVPVIPTVPIVPVVPPGPIFLGRVHLDSRLRWAGVTETFPAPEVPARVLAGLRLGGPAAGGSVPPRLSRLAVELEAILSNPFDVPGGRLLARLHETRQDAVLGRQLAEAYRYRTNRDLVIDIGAARLPFDPRPYLDHLLPDPGKAARLRNEAIATDTASPTFAHYLNYAIGTRNGAGASELLSRLNRVPTRTWTLQELYRSRYGISPDRHIEQCFQNSPEGEYLRYLLGDERLETSVVSVQESKETYQWLSAETFTRRDGVQGRIPFGHPEDGCYDRAHRMVMKLTEWGYSSSKVFAVRGHPNRPLLVQVDTAANAAPGRPQNVSWGYHVAPLVKVAHEGGGVFEVVLDPSLNRGVLGLDEWLQVMGVRRDGYLRFDFPDHVPGIRKGELGNLVGSVLDGRIVSDTALVYTAPRGRYYPSDHGTGLKDAAQMSAHVQDKIEEYAWTSEGRRLANLIDESRRVNYSDIGAFWNTVRTIRGDPQYRLLLSDAQAGRPWPKEIFGFGFTMDPKRTRFVWSVYNAIHTNAMAQPAPVMNTPYLPNTLYGNVFNPAPRQCWV